MKTTVLKNTEAKTWGYARGSGDDRKSLTYLRFYYVFTETTFICVRGYFRIVIYIYNVT